MSYEIDLNNYIESIGRHSHGFAGFGFRDLISDIEHCHGEFITGNDDYLFYAKGFFRNEITDKLYFFGKGNIKIANINKGEKGNLDGTITIDVFNKHDIESIKLTLGTNYFIELRLVIKDYEEVVFNNDQDSDGYQKNALREQIKRIYELVIE